MADVIAILWLMLLPLVILYCNNIALAGVIAKFYCGRSYCQNLMADVTAILVWWMVLPLLIVICLFSKVADVIAFM